MAAGRFGFCRFWTIGPAWWSVEALDALLAERIRTYNEHRLHSSLRDKTPQETLKEALSTSEVCIP
ncbi:MAG: transposase [Hydrogenibacillus schlegelii]|uniref:Transposase n=1 Tax=Hydrogenibacillus schlegelii TaxID=1484 RepID=A0A947CZD8_HYDSH|nr:transposase [Hydrogenibacillus schlegelii]